LDAQTFKKDGNSFESPGWARFEAGSSVQRADARENRGQALPTTTLRTFSISLASQSQPA